ncbi:Hypothetical protein HDN1F_35390 [gamma proteobacterium HdN1]|nr:Hypothetical protein HDN1F_17800 [gamma proteobacterium HdN1]CBL47122.1 Hypothetical protein HDN1F_35390 [gamma proteobacterium HdN1]
MLINGTLLVQRINGTHGSFSVGKIECEFGILNIKDPHLDQFDSGKYPGRFNVERIFPIGYMTRTGAFIVEIRAKVTDYLFSADEPGMLDSSIALTEIDPLESHSAQAVAILPPAPEKPAAPILQKAVPEKAATPKAPVVDTEMKAPCTVPVIAPPKPPATDPVAELFGELWPLENRVRLDPTTVRSDGENHRKRCMYLKQQGYKFRASSQTWEREGMPQLAVAEVCIL